MVIQLKGSLVLYDNMRETSGEGSRENEAISMMIGRSMTRQHDFDFAVILDVTMAI